MDFKVKCVKVNSHPEYFTEGKIYDVKNGVIKSDNESTFETWTYPEYGNADFKALKKWFSRWYDFELVEEKKMFTKSDLKTGMFGVMSNDFKFVVVNDKFIYSNGEWDTIDSLDDNLEMFSKRIEKVYDGVVSFYHLEGLLDGISWRTATLVYDRERDTKPVEPPKPLYNGKVVCIKDTPNGELYTVGKIYQFEDGNLTADDGELYPGCTKIYTFEDWAKWTSSKFIEIKE